MRPLRPWWTMRTMMATTTGMSPRRATNRVLPVFRPRKRKNPKTCRKALAPVMSFPHEILEDRLQVVVRRGDLLDREPRLENGAGQAAEELVPLMGLDDECPAVGPEGHLLDGPVADETGGEGARVARADRDLMRMGLDQLANVRDIALGQDLALVDQDDPRGQGLDLGQDMARDEDRAALLLESLDELDELALAQ